MVAAVSSSAQVPESGGGVVVGCGVFVGVAVGPTVGVIVGVGVTVGVSVGVGVGSMPPHSVA